MLIDFFKVLGIVIIGYFIIYMIFKPKAKNIEGLTTGTKKNKSKKQQAFDALFGDEDEAEDEEELIPTTTSPQGVTNTAASQAASIKATTIKMQDELLISKYKKDYETTIINFDDLLGTLMLQKVLLANSAGSDTLIKSLEELNTIKTARESLNITMKYLDNMNSKKNSRNFF